MKKILAIILTAIPILSIAKKSEAPDTISVRRAFLEMPAMVLDLIPKDTRGDMLIYFDNDSIWEAQNALDGRSKLMEVTPDYLKVNVTSVSQLQLKVLHGKKGDVVMSIYTVGTEDGGTIDSDIRFFDTSMSELDGSKYLSIPQLKDFFEFPKGSSTKMSDIEEMMPFYTLMADASPESEEITMTLTPDGFLSVEDMNLVRLFMKPTLKYSWDGNKMKIKN